MDRLVVLAWFSFRVKVCICVCVCVHIISCICVNQNYGGWGATLIIMYYVLHTDDISTLQHFNASTTTSDSISIDYQLANNMVCLLQQQSGAAAKICCVEKLNCECSAHSSSRCEPQNSRDCHDINEEMSLSSVTMEGLKSNTTYCVMAQVSVLSEVKWMDNSLMVVTDEALPTSQTQTSHGDGGGTTSSSQSPKGLCQQSSLPA